MVGGEKERNGDGSIEQERHTVKKKREAKRLRFTKMLTEMLGSKITHRYTETRTYGLRMVTSEGCNKDRVEGVEVWLYPSYQFFFPCKKEKKKIKAPDKKRGFILRLLLKLLFS